MAPDARADDEGPELNDTIFALSSGALPAAVAVVRVSGSKAEAALEALAGRLPPPRRMELAALSHRGELLDRALIVRFPGPHSATGEDVVELHLHGGRSVVAAVLAALGSLGGLREARPGEFTRRAFESGRIDLAEAEGLADLLQAETESQRRAAQAMAGGAVSRLIGGWRERLLDLSARLEAVLDFSDEGEVGDLLPEGWQEDLTALCADIAAMLARPTVERLRDGMKVVIAGPPNAGKSSLLNALAQREAAIVSSVAGTTRDVIEVPAAIAGTPFLLVDTAGLRESTDEVEAIGVERAQDWVTAADIVLWLGDPDVGPTRPRAIFVAAKADIREGKETAYADVAVSARTGQGLNLLLNLLGERARALLPAEGQVAINARHRAAAASALMHLQKASSESDFLLIAEELRLARSQLDRITGRAGVEDMLDALFGRFCIGK